MAIHIWIYAHTRTHTHTHTHTHRYTHTHTHTYISIYTHAPFWPKPFWLKPQLAWGQWFRSFVAGGQGKLQAIGHFATGGAVEIDPNVWGNVMWELAVEQGPEVEQALGHFVVQGSEKVIP